MDDCKLLHLENGGDLAFCEYGNAAGTPVLFFHGWPSSRTMAELADKAARELNVRIISPDRPGIRDSSDSTSSQSRAARPTLTLPRGKFPSASAQSQLRVERRR